MNEPRKLCQNAECDVRTTGVCRLGKDPVEGCPNYAQDDIPIADVDLALGGTTEKPTPVEICSGDVMHLDDLAMFIREKPVRTIALIGEHRAGKTTLLASIFAMYCKGPFAGYSFAGSRTLVGFARRHYLALLNSGRNTPTTPRTSRDDPVAFFHLALAKSGRDPVHLVISDRSGEAYGDARKDTSLISTLPELLHADRACFLLDGAKLASKEYRPAYARQFKQMIHALHDNGGLKNAKAVEVLATKFDLTTRGDADEQTKFLDDYEHHVCAEFRDHGLDIAWHRICALPKANRTIGFVGLDDMINRWTAPIVRSDILPVAIVDAQRQFDRLLTKTVET